MDWRLVFIPIAVFFWAHYWPTLKAKVVQVWSIPEDRFWWKVRSSFLAVFISAWPCLMLVWQNYGDTIIKFVITVIRARFGVPYAMRKAKLIPPKM